MSNFMLGDSVCIPEKDRNGTEEPAESRKVPKRKKVRQSKNGSNTTKLKEKSVLTIHQRGASMVKIDDCCINRALTHSI